MANLCRQLQQKLLVFLQSARYFCPISINSGISRQIFIKSRQQQNSVKILPMKAALPHADTEGQTNEQNEAFRYYAKASNYSKLYAKVQFAPHRNHGMLPLENQQISAEQGYNGCLKITRNTNTVCEKYRAFSIKPSGIYFCIYTIKPRGIHMYIYI
jgi:hypothetical protein